VTRRFKAVLLLLAAALVLFSVLALPEPASAQCALCKLSAAAGGARRAGALNTGILVLLLPPVGIFCAIFAVAYKHRRPRGED
jgi:hypothetical protein